MSALEPEVFFIGKNLDINFNSRYFETWDEAKAKLHEKSIVVIHWQNLMASKNRIGIEAEAKNWPLVHFIDASQKDAFFNNLQAMPIHAWLKDWSSKEVEATCFRLMQSLRQKEQEDELLKILEEQNQNLFSQINNKKKEQEELKNKTIKLQQKLDRQKKRKEASQRILLATLQSENLEDLSLKIKQSLAPIFLIKKVKIKLGAEIALSEQDKEVLEIPLLIENATTAVIYYFKDSAFKRHEENYLKDISEVIAIAVDRWLYGKHLKSWEVSWLNTFGAINNDIALIDQDYNLINTNRKVAGGKCYKTLFNKDEVCEGCQLGKNFKIHAYNKEQDRLDFYDVSGQSLEKSMQQNLFVHFYYPLKENTFYNKESVESAKWIDLGIISSSIAHELNNPLSGVLSYIQILLSEVDPKKEAYTILLEMQAAAKKSENIIKNLLSFSRRETKEDQSTCDIQKTFEKALQLMQADLNKEAILVEKKDLLAGEVAMAENSLMQVFLEVLKNALEELKEDKSNLKKKIKALCHSHNNSMTLELIDNGRGISEKQITKVFAPMFTSKNPSFHKGLGLTTARHLLSERGGSIEILPNQDQEAKGTKVKITLTRKKGPA